MSVEQAIKNYIKANCCVLEDPVCGTCRTDRGPIYKDELSDEDFCYTCLVTDLHKDEDALKDYMEVHDG